MNAASFPWGWLLLLLAWLTTTAILYAGFEADAAAAKDDRKKARNRVRNATRKATRKAERRAARLRPNDSDDSDDNNDDNPDSGGATDSSDANTDSSDTDKVDLLRRELEDLASQLPPLQSTIIQLESANSTLESTNSDLQSRNTILRSANAKLQNASDEAAKERRRADRLEASLHQQQMFDMQLLAELDREQLRDKSGDDKHFKAKLDLAKASKEAAIQERDKVQQELNRLHGSHQAEIAALTSEKDRLGEDMQSERTIASELRNDIARLSQELSTKTEELRSAIVDKDLSAKSAHLSSEKCLNAQFKLDRLEQKDEASQKSITALTADLNAARKEVATLQRTHDKKLLDLQEQRKAAEIGFKRQLADASEERLLLEGNITSLLRDVENLNKRLTRELDLIEENRKLRTEVDQLKLRISQIQSPGTDGNDEPSNPTVNPPAPAISLPVPVAFPVAPAAPAPSPAVRDEPSSSKTESNAAQSKGPRPKLKAKGPRAKQEAKLAAMTTAKETTQPQGMTAPEGPRAPIPAREETTQPQGTEPEGPHLPTRETEKGTPAIQEEPTPMDLSSSIAAAPAESMQVDPPSRPRPAGDQGIFANKGFDFAFGAGALSTASGVAAASAATALPSPTVPQPSLPGFTLPSTGGIIAPPRPLPAAASPSPGKTATASTAPDHDMDVDAHQSGPTPVSDADVDAHQSDDNVSMTDSVQDELLELAGADGGDGSAGNDAEDQVIDPARREQDREEDSGSDRDAEGDSDHEFDSLFEESDRDDEDEIDEDNLILPVPSGYA